MSIRLFTGAAIILAIAFGGTTANAVSVVNFAGEALNPDGNATSITTENPFDLGNASKLVVAISGEVTGPETARVANSLAFGNQALTFAGAVSDTVTIGIQRTEIWYIDQPFADIANITVNWDGNANGTGFGIISLNDVALGAPALVADAQGLSVTANVPGDVVAPIDNSIVISSFTANAGLVGLDDVASPDLVELYAEDIGSAVGAAGYQLVPDPGAAGLAITHAYTANGARPVTLAAVWETDIFRAVAMPPTPGDTDGDGDVDVDDFNNIRDSLGYSGLQAGVGVDIFGADGIVDFRDLRLFQENFPTVVAAAAAVPEPSSLLLVCLAISGLAVRRRSRR